MSTTGRSRASEGDDRHSKAALRSDPDLDALDFVLHQIPVGILLIDGSRIVVWTNRSARALLRSGDGIALHEGRLTAASPAETGALDRLVQHAVAGTTGEPAHDVETIALSRSSEGTALIAVVRSIERPAGQLTNGAARAVVFLSDPEHDLRVSRERLRSLFKLTPAECQLVALLTAGSSLSAAARRLAITIETARTYLKRVFEKTGTRRQAELVRLALAVATAGAGDA